MRMKAGFAAGAALAAAGCSFSIGTEDVFSAQDSGFHAASVAEMRMNGEEALAPAAISHGFLDYGDGEQLAWTLVERPGDAGAARPLVVHCGGNASDRYNDGTHYARKAVAFADIFQFDYPGYGDSSGAPGEVEFEAMLPALLEHVDELAGEDRALVFWGHSLGGFVCSALAERFGRADGVIMETTARNAAEVAQSWRPWWAVMVQVKIQPSLRAYDNANSLAAIDAPVLVFAGQWDGTLEPALARSLFDALIEQGVDAEFIEFPEGGHDDLPGQDGYAEAVGDFFARIAGN